jgi:hypothetical protein
MVIGLSFLRQSLTEHLLRDQDKRDIQDIHDGMMLVLSREGRESPVCPGPARGALARKVEISTFGLKPTGSSKKIMRFSLFVNVVN